MRLEGLGLVSWDRIPLVSWEGVALVRTDLGAAESGLIFLAKMDEGMMDLQYSLQ